MELHCLRNHIEPTRLEFLPYHFLLVSVGATGYIKWQDTSTGALVAEHRTKLGACSVLKQNPHNAVSCLGHSNGTVTMWSPSMTTPLVRMLCHSAPVRALAVDRSGTYMATSGLDGTLAVWDVRTYRKVHSYFTARPADTLDISATGMLSAGCGPHVQVWKDALAVKAAAPYLNHMLPGELVCDVAFRPFDDVLAVGHSGGLGSLIVPGSGEPNYDALEANPFQTREQRREDVVHKLLDKLQPGMITLNPNVIGAVDRAPQEAIAAERRVADAANRFGGAAAAKEPKAKKKMRGKNKISRKMAKRQQNIIDTERQKFRELQAAKKQATEDAAQRKSSALAPAPARDALSRFAPTKRLKSGPSV